MPGKAFGLHGGCPSGAHLWVETVSLHRRAAARRQPSCCQFAPRIVVTTNHYLALARATRE
jgi:hypothetical protein